MLASYFIPKQTGMLCAFRFQGKIGEESRYPREFLAVGISYNKETKKHSCKVEVLS